MRPIQLTCFVTFLVVLVACASRPPKDTDRDRSTGDGRPTASQPAPEAPAEAEIPIAEREPVPPEVLYEVIAGEVAGQHEDYVAAANHYLKAARTSNDPAIAERATQIALYAGANDLAQQAVTRLLELTPDSRRAHTTAVTLSLHRSDGELARRHLERLLELGGNTEETWTQLARMLTRSPEPDFALERMHELALANGQDRHAWFALSQLASHFERLDDALEYAERALALDPDWAQGLAWRGRLRLSDADYEGAASDLEAALELDPDDPEIRLHYAEALRRNGDYERAQRVLEPLPQDPPLIQTRASLAVEAENWSLAREQFRKLLDHPEYGQSARYFLGHIAETEKRYEEALSWYAQVNDGDLRLDARIRSAAVVARQGRLEDARAQLAALKREGPESAEEAWLAEGQILEEADRIEEAFQAYEHGMESMQDDSGLRYARALLAAEQGRVELAESDLRILLEQDPEDAQALNALGYTLAEQTERYQEALDLITRALELAPDDAAVVDSMGWVQYRLGHHDRAIEHLQRALKLQFDPEIAAHLGEVLWVTGRRDEARDVWQRALDKRPEDSDIVRRTMERLTP